MFCIFFYNPMNRLQKSDMCLNGIQTFARSWTAQRCVSPFSAWPIPKPTHRGSWQPICLATSSRTDWSTSCPMKPPGSACSQSEAWRAQTTSTPATLTDTGMHLPQKERNTLMWPDRFVSTWHLDGWAEWMAFHHAALACHVLSYSSLLYTCSGHLPPCTPLAPPLTEHRTLKCPRWFRRSDWSYAHVLTVRLLAGSLTPFSSLSFDRGRNKQEVTS